MMFFPDLGGVYLAFGGVHFVFGGVYFEFLSECLLSIFWVHVFASKYSSL